VAFWFGCFGFVQWFRLDGWMKYLTIVIPIGIAVAVVAKNKKGRRALGGVGRGLEWVGRVMDDRAGAIIALFVLLGYGGILWFLLMAPYGVLCELGFKRCGEW